MHPVVDVAGCGSCRFLVVVARGVLVRGVSPTPKVEDGTVVVSAGSVDYVCCRCVGTVVGL